MGVFSQQYFGQFGGSHMGDMDPNTFNNNCGSSFQGGYSQSANRNGGFDDDELLDSLESNDTQSKHLLMNRIGGDSGDMNQFGFHSNIYEHNDNHSLSLKTNNLYSNTPETDTVASPFVHDFNQGHFRMPSHNYGSSIQTPNSFTGSPITVPDVHSCVAPENSTFTSTSPKMGVSDRNNTCMTSPLTPKTPVISSLNICSNNGSNFTSQPIRTASANRHQKNLSGQWDQTSSSLKSFSSEFSPTHNGHLNVQISEILRGTSMPVKSNNSLQSAPTGMQSQEMKRRRRRESHNLVERRRRDNINERIQELCHLVPMHRLEDEKVRKALQSNSPLSPTLAGTSISPSGLSPPQATSGLAGPGARRAAAGNITTGIPLEEKDKGPNKGDILNGAVSWTRDLMWMLHLKLQQQEDLANYIVELGGQFPFQQSEDERRMQTELMDAILKNDGDKFHYSRAPGSGLRVPKHTDVKGDVLNSSAQADQVESMSSENHCKIDAGQVGMDPANRYWNGRNSGDSGAGSVSFKEEEEYCMDLMQ